MKLSLKPKVVLIANPDFCNPYPNPLNGIPVAMKKMGIDFLLMNPTVVDFKEFKRQIEQFEPELLFGLIQLKHEIMKIGEFFGNYSKESRRFLKFLFPRDRSIAGKMLLLPLKVILPVWFRKIMPVSCYFLDRLDKDKNFTVGYFVEASKKKN